MVCNLNDIWNELSKLYIKRASKYAIINLENPCIHLERKRMTRPALFDNYEYENLEFNINKIMLIYEALCEYENNREKDYSYNASFKHKLIDLKIQSYCEDILGDLITTLEAYLVALFKRISKDIYIKNLEIQKLKKFLIKNNYKYKKKKFYNKDHYVKKFIKANQDKKLSEILKPSLYFQQGKYSKIAYSLIGINLPSLNNTLWGKIFSKGDPKSYVELRHRITHKGAESLLTQQLSIEDIEEAIIGCMKFIFIVECERQRLYPYGPDIAFFYD